MKKIAICGTVGIPACYGGFETLVENLTKVDGHKYEFVVFCSSKNYQEKMKHHNNAKLVYLPISANGLSSILYDCVSLILSLVKRVDTILLLGVSGAMLIPFVRLFSPRTKVITNIDGLEWKRDKWSPLAKKFLKTSEFLAVKYSNDIICDNEAITNYVFEEYSIKPNTIAYGGDHVLGLINKTGSIYNVPNCQYLSVCRIEPENNVEMILEAFSLQQEKITFVGNWENSAYGRRLKEQYSSFKNILLLDPIYDPDSLHKLRNSCTGYVHGHSAGGTNPSLVEIMFYGVNVIAYDCSFNRYTTENKAQYFEDVSGLLRVLSEKSHMLEEENKSMKDIAVRKYTWEKIAKDYSNLY
ncbi:DUF1972 domain-containing protein [Vibrio cyclitrophicus]